MGPRGARRRHADAADARRSSRCSNAARAPGRTFTREELVARAFGPDYEGLDRTVDTHVTNLRRKLDRRRAADVVATVHGIGYRLGLGIVQRMRLRCRRAC